MLEIIKDTFIDSILLLPFLFVAFLIIELIEHKLSSKSKKIISKSGQYGPFLGSLLGLLPQCGFSVMATNLYVTRIISLGTLIAIYLSTSDEMLPILLAEKAPIETIIKILLIKLIIGMVSGFIIDLIYRKEKDKPSYEICDKEHCHCDNNLIKSVIIHTINTYLFILVITFIINIIFDYYGSDLISKIFLHDSFFSPFISSLIGLIPNCGASVAITELYLNQVLSFGSMIAGLLTSSGVALVVLFKQNKNIKDNIKIVLIIYFIGVLSGLIINSIKLLQ
ncbi:MAG TPA: putative manganese transporter [Bacilli bacterium]|nr:putative manganese transporter [Bacilli bacterium]